MIVVDTNIIAHFYIAGEATESAQQLLRAYPDWITSPIWRSEMRNILKKYFSASLMTKERAFSIMAAAEKHMGTTEVPVNSFDVLEVCFAHKCTAYDAEFVALARINHLPLVTTDKKLVNEFPEEVHQLSIFVSKGPTSR